MAMLVLEATKRSPDVKAKDLRKQKLLPAVCYGQEMSPLSIQMDYQTFRRAFREVSTTQVFNVDVEGERIPVLVKEIAFNPLDNSFDHVDFLKVNMKEEVEAEVPVVLEGVSGAVKNFNGVLNFAKQEVMIKALPMDIPHEIKIDLAILENLGDSVHVSDLKLGDKVEILDELEDMVVTVSAAKEYKEEEVEVPDAMKEEGEAAEGGSEKKEEAKSEEGEKKED